MATVYAAALVSKVVSEHVSAEKKGKECLGRGCGPEEPRVGCVVEQR